MGSIEYFNTVYETDLERAYWKVIEDVRADGRTGPHPGTIAGSDGYEVVADAPVRLAEASDLASCLLDEGERFRTKGGPAGAIPLLDRRRTITAEIPDRPEGYAGFEEAQEAALAGLLGPEERVLDGETTAQCKMTHPRYPGDPGRPRGGHVTVHIEGGEERHAGWLFFGTAAW